MESGHWLRGRSIQRLNLGLMHVCLQYAAKRCHDLMQHVKIVHEWHVFVRLTPIAQALE